MNGACKAYNDILMVFCMVVSMVYGWCVNGVWRPLNGVWMVYQWCIIVVSVWMVDRWCIDGV